jgi:nitrogenase molybdenum-iron protein alpha/beta subunit
MTVIRHESKKNKAVSDRFGIPFGYPHIVGTYLAINAVPDIWMLVDSADCATLRAEIIHDNHDWNSTLISEDGHYRIAATGVCPHSIALDRYDDLRENIAAIGNAPGSFLFVYPAPVTAIVGIDYSVVIKQLQGQMNLKAITVSPVDAVGDWLTGYAHIMEVLAREVELPDSQLDEDAVALVGYLWDRNEGDHRASLAELRGLMDALDLDVASVWFSGRDTTALQEVARAGTIVELPYAGRAAEILAERTGARVVKAPGLPIGLDGTFSWMEKMGELTGRSGQARAFIEAQAPAAYQKVTKAVLHHFVGKDFMIATEPHVCTGVAAMVREFGGNVRLAAPAGKTVGDLTRFAEQVLQDSSLEVVGTELTRTAEHCSLPVLIGNVRAIASAGPMPIVVVPLGFQSGGTHYLHDTPFLGLAGTYSLIDRIANAVNLAIMRS